MNRVVFFVFISFNYYIFGQCFDENEYNVITSMEEALKNPEEVITLELFDKKLKQIPSEIQYFKNLKYLCLSDNQIQQIPEFITSLDNLEILVLSNNQIQYLPEDIYKMNKLNVLFLSFNKLQELPSSISKLSNLTDLYLMGNQLKALPFELKDSPKLKFIDVRVNKIPKKRIKKLRKLSPNLIIWSNSYHWYQSILFYLKNPKNIFNSK